MSVFCSRAVMVLALVCAACSGDVQGGDDKGSLYERLGGEPSVTKAVDVFYGKVIADEGLAPFFEGKDIAHLKKKQTAFLTYAFGGPNEYTGASLRVVHLEAVEKGLSDEHFDAVAGHLLATLKELGVAQAEIDTVMEIAGSTRVDVLNR